MPAMALSKHDLQYTLNVLLRLNVFNDQGKSNRGNCAGNGSDGSRGERSVSHP